MSHTVLCADDDRHLCQILARALREEGYRVETAHDGEAALSLLREVAPSLVILDVILPKRDGFAVLEAIREERGSLPVILYSGCTFTPEYEERAGRLGADAVLHKPVPLAQLVGRVAELVARGPPRPARGPLPTAPPRRSPRRRSSPAGWTRSPFRRSSTTSTACAPAACSSSATARRRS